MAKKQRMTPAQQKYAMARVDTIVSVATKKIQDKFTTPAKYLSDREELLLLKAGKVKMLPIDKIKTSNYLRITDVFDYSEFLHSEKYDKKAAEKFLNPIYAKAKVVRDCIMLGDADEALRLLRSFESEQ
jgi:hypothetical protein